MNWKIAFVQTILLVAACVSPSAFADEGKDKHACCSAADPGALILPSDKMFGEGQVAYEAARKIPRLCCKLFCYCGCDQINGHTTLLECFTNENCADCQTCDEEVIQALRLSKEGKSLKETQEYIDVHFQDGYFGMFKMPSKAYLDYQKKRLWQPIPKDEPVIRLEGN
ncbi:MAG TPA: PCYCGC motif-containing (lipo)protein [Trichormus sp.]|jgi:hypothetical protein